MYSLPTTRSAGLFTIGWGALLVVLLLLQHDTYPLLELGLGMLLGLLSGGTHLMASDQVPSTLTNAGTDLPARRLAFHATASGRLHTIIELTASVALLVGLFWPGQPVPIVAYLAYATSRHALTFTALKWRGGSVKTAN